MNTSGAGPIFFSREGNLFENIMQAAGRSVDFGSNSKHGSQLKERSDPSIEQDLQPVQDGVKVIY